MRVPQGACRPDPVAQTISFECRIEPKLADREWESRRSAKRPNVGHRNVVGNRLKADIE